MLDEGHQNVLLYLFVFILLTLWKHSTIYISTYQTTKGKNMTITYEILYLLSREKTTFRFEVTYSKEDIPQSNLEHWHGADDFLTENHFFKALDGYYLYLVDSENKTKKLVVF